jgi:hypothetical protein
MTHLLDRTRTAAGGVAGACVGGVSGRVVSEAAGMPPSRFGGIGIGIAYGLRGQALNPSWFVALPQQ